MPENRPGRSPEAFVPTRATSVAVSRAVKTGEFRRLASRLYSGNFADDPASVPRRNLWRIAGGYFPGGLIAGRTAPPIIRTLDYAQRWTSALDWRELSTSRQEMESCNAFRDSGEADDK